jgi:copper chaperone NosL
MRKYFYFLLFCLVGLGFTLSGCATNSDQPRPPDIAYGQELCDQCGMTIDEPRFAASTLLTNDEYLRFDDAGEMLVYHMDHPEAQVQAWFVHDYHSEKWLRGEDAFFVESSKLKTPMGTGIVAFAKRADAESFAAEWNGKVYTLDEIRIWIHEKIHGSVSNSI